MLKRKWLIGKCIRTRRRQSRVQIQHICCAYCTLHTAQGRLYHHVVSTNIYNNNNKTYFSWSWKKLFLIKSLHCVCGRWWKLFALYFAYIFTPTAESLDLSWNLGKPPPPHKILPFAIWAPNCTPRFAKFTSHCFRSLLCCPREGYFQPQIFIIIRKI